jgi:hypothetical protein
VIFRGTGFEQLLPDVQDFEDYCVGAGIVHDSGAQRNKHAPIRAKARARFVSAM